MSGSVLIGPSAGPVQINVLGKSTFMRCAAGCLLALLAWSPPAVAALTGALSTTSVPRSLSTSADVTVGGATRLVGSLRLGADSPYTIGRAGQTTAGKGRSTVIIGQASGLGSCVGGDVVIDAGTGSAPGAVKIGSASLAVQLGAPTIVVGALTASSFSTSGGVTMNNLVSSGLAAVGPLSAWLVTAMGIAPSAAFTVASLQPVVCVQR